MSPVILRNPPGRWAAWLGIGIAGLIAVVAALPNATSCTDSFGNPCQAPSAWVWLLFTSPFWIAFFIVAYFSFRARVVLDDTGLRVKAAWDHKTYSWADITDVRLVKTRRYTNNIRSGTERRLDILVRGKGWTELPVPKAGLLLGKAAFDQQAQLLWQIWHQHH
jgi:hypothetical protein